MRRQRIVTIATAIAVAIVLGVSLPAVDSRAEITQEKHKLIKEFMSLYGVENIADQMSYTVLTDIRRGYPSLVEYAVNEQENISDENRERLATNLADFEACSVEFHDRFASSMGFPDVSNEVFFPLFDQHFSEQDLNQILAFYRTAVGRKTLQIMPEVIQQGMVNLNEIVQSRVGFLIRDIFDAERARLGE